MSMDTRPSVSERCRPPAPACRCPHGGVAIGIAASDGADAHRLGRGEAAAIAHRVTRLQTCTADDARAQAHRRAQTPVRGIVAGVVGRAAVAQDAGAHPVLHCALGVAQGGRAVGEAALAGQALGGGLEHGELVVDARSPSASEKCVISPISSTCGKAESARARRGRRWAQTRGGSCRELSLR